MRSFQLTLLSTISREVDKYYTKNRIFHLPSVYKYYANILTA